MPHLEEKEGKRNALQSCNWRVSVPQRFLGNSLLEAAYSFHTG